MYKRRLQTLCLLIIVSALLAICACQRPVSVTPTESPTVPPASPTPIPASATPLPTANTRAITPYPEMPTAASIKTMALPMVAAKGTGRTATPHVAPLEPTTDTPTPTPTNTPFPTPLPLPTGVAKRSNIGPYLLSHPETGQPTHNLLKNGHMRAYMAVNPAHWTPADQLPHMEGYGRNWIPPEEELALIDQGAEGGRIYFERFRESYEHCRPNIHAWMSTWAFRYGDPEFAAKWASFQTEWLRLMHEHGFKAGVGGMKTHLFKPGEFAWLAPAISEADYLFLAESGAPTLMSSIGKSTLVYRRLIAELRDALPADKDIPPLILDVCVDGQVLNDLQVPGGPWRQRGYRDFGISPEDYAADVRAYDIATLYDPYVKHVFWFATNITKDTISFDVNTPMLAIADHWHVAP